VLTLLATTLCMLVHGLGPAPPGADGAERPPWAARGHPSRGDVPRRAEDEAPAGRQAPPGTVPRAAKLQGGAPESLGSAPVNTGQEVLGGGAGGSAEGDAQRSRGQGRPVGAASGSREDLARSPSPSVFFEEHVGSSCQGYVHVPPIVSTLDVAKQACIADDACNSIECPVGTTIDCTLRRSSDFVEYPPAVCYLKVDPEDAKAKVHPAYKGLLKEYPFQPVTTQDRKQVNIILVRTPWGASGDARKERGLYEKYKDDILFLGISSFEDYPLDAMNPYSPRLDVNYFLGAFPGFLHMMRQPEKHFPPHVKTLLMSQSDFQLPDVLPEDLLHVSKKYDFTYAATWPLGQSPTDSRCMGWSGYAKNWTFVKQALQVMCGEYNLKGVLIATRGEGSNERCTIPDSCQGQITQTTFVKQETYFNFIKQSRFSFVPQVHDASPRVATQALVHDVPLLMNKHISGGWKYINENTGEFFHDMSDFRQSLEKILHGAATPGTYQPRKWVLENYGDEHSGKRLLAFVKENFADRVTLPKNTRLLLT